MLFITKIKYFLFGAPAKVIEWSNYNIIDNETLNIVETFSVPYNRHINIYAMCFIANKLKISFSDVQPEFGFDYESFICKVSLPNNIKYYTIRKQNKNARMYNM